MKLLPPQKRLPPDRLDVELRDMSDALLRGMPRVPPPPVAMAPASRGRPAAAATTRRDAFGLAAFVVSVGAVAWCAWAISSWWDRVGNDYRARQNQEAVERAADMTKAVAQGDAERAERAATEQKEAAGKAARVTREKIYLSGITPALRLVAVRLCARNPLDCPGGRTLDSVAPDWIYEAAKSPAERKSLEAAFAQAGAAAARSNASVKCCDGSESESCTCGNQHSGCCSHHGGVCGCVAP